MPIADRTRQKHFHEAPTIPNSIGDALRQLRKAAGLSQQEVVDAICERSGHVICFSQSMLSHYETGKHIRIGPERVEALEDFYRLRRGELYARADMPGAAAVVRESALPGAIVIAAPTPHLRELIEVAVSIPDGELPPIIRAARFVHERLSGVAQMAPV